MSTTLSAIREDMARIIRGLTPTSLAGHKFRRFDSADHDTPFLEQMENNAAAAFRQFAIADTFDDELSDVINNRSWDNTLLVVVVAYPNRHTSLFGSSARDVRDVIREDRDMLKDKIGDAGYANYTEPVSITLDATGVERGDNVSFLTLDIRCRFWRTVNT